MGEATIETARTTEALPAGRREADPTSPFPRGRTRTLGRERFDAACAELMERIERDFAPTLLVGVRTGGLVVAEAMARAAAHSVPVLPLTCRRPATGVKARLPGLKKLLGSIPESWRDALRRAEHRLTTKHRRGASPPPVDQDEAAAIGAWLRAANATPRVLVTDDTPRVLVTDDAVDSGVTLNAVLRTLRTLCPPGTDLRSAAITVTLDDPIVEPDYALYRGVLCRFPWSFDAGA